ncbi:unnamed protein product [Absidia cylindrospora]
MCMKLSRSLARGLGAKWYSRALTSCKNTYGNATKITKDLSVTGNGVADRMRPWKPFADIKRKRTIAAKGPRTRIRSDSAIYLSNSFIYYH